jgi:hypothetical protein
LLLYCSQLIHARMNMTRLPSTLPPAPAGRLRHQADGADRLHRQFRQPARRTAGGHV